MNSQRISTNFVVNLSGAFIPVAVSLLTVPFYIREIGTERYGVLAIVWVLLGYFGFLDLGLSRAAANALARLHANDRERAEVLSTCFAMNLGLGLAGGIVIFAFGSALLEVATRLPADLVRETRAAMPWVALLLPVAMMFGVAEGALESRERFVTANIITTTGTALGQIAPIMAAVWISPTLDVVIPVAVMARILSFAVLLAIALRGEASLSPSLISRPRMRQLLSYGGWVSVSGIVAPLLTTLDQIIIARTLGVGAVTHYSVPMSLVTRTQILASSLSKTLFPRLSRHDAEEARDLAERGFMSMAFAFGSVCAAAIVIIHPFLALWIDRDFAATASLTAQILFVGGWLNGMAFIPFALLQGQGRPDLVARFHLLEAVPYVAVLLGMTVAFGLPGAAAAWTLRVAVDAMLLCWAARFRWAVFLRVLLPGGGMVFAVLLGTLGTLPPAAAFLGATGLALCILCLGLVFDPTGRHVATLALRRLRS